MQSDSIKKYIRLRDSLIAERNTITQRLQEIAAALGDGSTTAAVEPKPKVGRPRKSVRVSNELSLKEAVLKATGGKALTKEEVLAAVLQLGYQFKTTNPLNSIGTVLYGKKPKFKNADGKFSLA